MAKLGEANVGGRLVPAWLMGLTAEELDGIKWHSNPNLLDNPWFTVNQRGKNTYNGAGYAVDRWYLWVNSTLTKNSNGSITLSSSSWRNLIQIFELGLFNKLVGKTVTASVLLDDDTVSSCTFVFTDPRNSYKQFNLYPNPFSGKVFSIFIYGSSNTNIANRPYFNLYTNVDVTVKAMKLELGSVSTLANDVPPNYQQELAKCQRYFWRSAEQRYMVGVAANGNQLMVQNIPFPTKMRASPSVSFPQGIGYKIGSNNWISPYVSPSSIEVYPHSFTPFLTISGLTNGTGVWVHTNEIVASADL